MSVVSVTRFDKKVTLYTIRELRKMSPSGEMAEWFNATVLKTVVPRGTLSSNLSLSASYNQSPDRGFFVGWTWEGECFRYYFGMYNYHPSTRYQHYKWGFYEIVCEATAEATLGQVIVYRGLWETPETQWIWVRERGDFEATIITPDWETPRFTVIV